MIPGSSTKTVMHVRLNPKNKWQRPPAKMELEKTEHVAALTL